MSQAVLDQFITTCRQYNTSFRTDAGGGPFKKSSLYGLLEFLRKQIKSNKIKAFTNLQDAITKCENPRDPRIVKYYPAITWLVDAWGKEAPPDASHALLFLRKNPQTAAAKAGFSVTDVDRGTADTGGRCHIKCEGRPPVFSLIIRGNGCDWYIPYAHAEAKSVLVPFGQPDGTLVVTFPMNGCALEVRQETVGNRFFHDADGRNMPHSTVPPKFRADYRRYGGTGDPVAHLHEEMRGSSGETNIYPGQFHFDLFAVKKGGLWHVCQTASMSLVYADTGNIQGVKVFKREIEHYLGSFADRA